ncbi:MAG: MarR family transcriptional regulator [Rhodospirillales bacterium]|jgi:DNA-binding MarR family transcriptional regulator|nr:MarR family transcriptional regulator [Rhodospirillales bacterium]
MDSEKTTAALPPSESLGFLIRDTMMHLHKVLRTYLQDYGISTAQWFLLRVLWEEEGLSQRQLSIRVSTTEPTTQSALLRMEKQGIVRRVKDPKDKRTNRIYLTKKGRELEARMIPYAMEVNEVASQGISKKNIKALKTIMGRVRGNLLNEIESYD